MEEINKEERLLNLAREYLSGYRFCEDMLHLRRYERKRALEKEESCHSQELISGSEGLWKARMEETKALIAGLKNGREKLMIYYRYIRGESVEHAATLLNVSRRTGYRMLNRGLLVVGAILERLEK